MTKSSLRDEIAQEVDALHNLLVEKNQAYGNSAGQTPLFAKDVTQETAIMIRANDKIRRLDNLLKTGGPVNDETISDTIRDLAGYCVLWLIARRYQDNTNPAKCVCTGDFHDDEML